MRGPIGGEAGAPGNAPLTAQRLVGLLVAFLLFAGVLWYLIVIA